MSHGRARAATILSLLAGLAAAVPACGRSGPVPGEERSGTPTGIPSPLDVGDGHDGALTVDADVVASPCHRLESVGDGQILLAGPVAFGGGRRLLLLQVQDTGAESANQTPLGGMHPPGLAGSWDIVESVAVLSLGSSVVVSVASAPAAAFGSDAARRAQACEMPEYTDVTVGSDGRLRAQDWDGARGGVVAFFASGTVTLEGDVDASEAGFRGGVRGNDQIAFDTVTPDTTSATGGGKGEGLDIRSWTRFGRGNYWNAAGGGNGHNAGGGGGGNGGRGGFGSPQQGSTGTQTDLDTRGMPGAGVVANPELLVFGGAGGAGHANSGAAGRGGRGGGLVLMFVQALAGDGDIDVSGEDGEDSAGSGSTADGGGGGGAGGSALIRVRESAASFSGTVKATGGGGGDSDARPPGAGAGGGRVFLGGLSPEADVSGGAQGVETSGTATSLAAEDGEAGVVVLYPP